jgi:hypothetical protein
MTRMVNCPDLLLPAVTGPTGAGNSNELTGHVRDAYELTIFPPVTLPEADIGIQIFTGTQWAFYDTSNFVAGPDNYKTITNRGLGVRLRRRAGTNPAADRLFETVKKVGGSGA